MKFAIKNKVSRQAGFGVFEILFIIAVVGIISCIAMSASYEHAIPPLPPDSVIEEGFISFLLLIFAAPVCLAGWLGKLKFLKWDASAIRRAKYRVAVFSFVSTLLLGAIEAPSVLPARTTSQQNACINNLRLIDSAKRQWALDKGKGPNDVPAASDLQPYLDHGTPGAPLCCPVDKTQTFASSYSINNVATKPTCKICPSSHILP
jgi:hypothetical protein